MSVCLSDSLQRKEKKRQTDSCTFLFADKKTRKKTHPILHMTDQEKESTDDEEYVQDFVVLTPSLEIKTITIMKDVDKKEFYRRTSSGRWIRCGERYQKQLIKNQKRLIKFMHKNSYLLNIDIERDESSSSNSGENDVDDEKVHLP